nr:glycoside hydrolase domain-containing protein [Amycolatopsis jejuensis]
MARTRNAAASRTTSPAVTCRTTTLPGATTRASAHRSQPRGQDGRFPDGPAYRPPAPGKFGQDGFGEGNAAQYTWLVPQNPAGLVTAMGGPAAVAGRLDTFFRKLNVGPNEPYMWAGNEPDFGVPWLDNYAGQPWKTQEVVRHIATTLFSAAPDGEPGNDDLGAQSSWYVWAALGIYPVDPGHPGPRDAHAAGRAHARPPRARRVGDHAVRARSDLERPSLGPDVAAAEHRP